MTITLHDYTLSGSCYKVRLMLGFLGLDYERRPVDFFPGREHKSPEFLAINPLGQVPVLDDGGVRLRDAQAILVYLARAYDPGGSWLPTAPAALGAVMQWLAFAGGPLMAVSAARLHDALGYPMVIDAVRRDAHAALAILDDHLSERAIEGGLWLVGAAPTIADVACFAYPALAGDGGIGLEPFPALRKWLLAFRRLDGFHAMPGVPEFA